MTGTICPSKICKRVKGTVSITIKNCQIVSLCVVLELVPLRGKNPFEQHPSS